MHWAMHRNEGETAIQMGDTIKTVKTHYVNPRAEQTEAEKFWRISRAGKGNIILLGAKAG
jgi:hypothetical protein